MFKKLAHDTDGKGQPADVTPVITITRTISDTCWSTPSNQSQII
ncbi:class III lanthipeptide [Paenibacillus thiaminolyticus]